MYSRVVDRLLVLSAPERAPESAEAPARIGVRHGTGLFWVRRTLSGTSSNTRTQENGGSPFGVSGLRLG